MQLTIMNDRTPQRKTRSCVSICVPLRPEKEVVPEPLPVTEKSHSKRQRINGDVEIEKASNIVTTESVDKDTFNGHKTMRRGELRKAKNMVRESEIVDEVGGCDGAKCRYKTELIEVKNKRDLEVKQLIEKYVREISELRARLGDVDSAAEAVKEELAQAWKVESVAKHMVKSRLSTLNGGHAKVHTDSTYTYRVNNELVGICLHCFAANRLPALCLFKKGKVGVRFHRKSAKHCIKPGIRNRNDPSLCDFRMIEGKDFLECR